MKPLSSFSRIAIIGYSLYFIFQIVVYLFNTQVPLLFTASLPIAYAASFITVAAWIKITIYLSREKYQRRQMSTS